jgi:flagellar biosynthesis protein FlhG
MEPGRIRTGCSLADPIHDQAEGLRRLLVQNYLRIVTLTSGSTGAGKTTAVINLAAALARNGKSVLVIDENTGANNICGLLGLNAHRDLLDVIRRDKTVQEVVISSVHGFSILPAGHGMRALEKLNAGDRAHLIGSFAHLTPPFDVVLIDAAPGRASRSLSLALSSHEIVVVASPEAASITAAYALIKHINGNYQNKRRYHILINKAVTEIEANTIFSNMESAARRYLGISLEFLGYIPYEHKLCPSNPLPKSLSAASFGEAFQHAAESLIHWPFEEDEGRGLERFMQCLLQSSPVSQGARMNGVTAES